jgi:hypothetical protein
MILSPKNKQKQRENSKQFKTIKKPKCQECVSDFVIIRKKEVCLNPGLEVLFVLDGDCAELAADVSQVHALVRGGRL